MQRFLLLCVTFAFTGPALQAQPLLVGFGESNVTPDPAKKDVWLAGFGKGRKATKIHDPLMARAVVLAHDKQKIAIVSVDVVGLFHDVAVSVRKQLPGFTYVLVSSTHNHEGPDTMGLWGENLFASGIDPDYMKALEAGIVKAIQDADKGKKEVTAVIGAANAPDLLHDGREPYVKHDELVVLRFQNSRKITTGIVVQWNCHPETLSSKNTEISADYVGYTVEHLKKKHDCPVVYLTGTVGGLMTSLRVEVKDDQGKALADGTFEKTERYGQLVGKLADKALAAAKPVKLTPFEVRTKSFFMPIDNAFYVLGFNLGVLKRDGYLWKGDPLKADPVGPKPDPKARMAIKSEVGWIKLGDLEIAAIPGEIYPELVLSKVQDPPDKGADYPDAAIEPGIYAQMKSKHRMIVGLANDEIGYIIPKRQWDAKAPFCYGRKKAQYGEENSLGPETAPILCEMFRSVAERK
ncbi:MAG: neutral/alkaline non-lysosomal ceramidase N-terminal domain-containing protein [Planctomycetes bacterium]|nr:neutral/alkaline non-lysosomal ceramidase N-terminal domain-containing protein [Planctomycetota bacterium]